MDPKGKRPIEDWSDFKLHEEVRKIRRKITVLPHQPTKLHATWETGITEVPSLRGKYISKPKVPSFTRESWMKDFGKDAFRYAQYEKPTNLLTFSWNKELYDKAKKKRKATRRGIRLQEVRTNLDAFIKKNWAEKKARIRQGFITKKKIGSRWTSIQDKTLKTTPNTLWDKLKPPIQGTAFERILGQVSRFLKTAPIKLGMKAWNVLGYAQNEEELLTDVFTPMGEYIFDADYRKKWDETHKEKHWKDNIIPDAANPGDPGFIPPIAAPPMKSLRMAHSAATARGNEQSWKQWKKNLLKK